MSWRVEFLKGNINLPEIDLWCDSRKPAPYSFVSHAHFDHLSRHRRIISSEGTHALMELRMPGKREGTILPYNLPFQFNAETELRLYPAGHIFGSSMMHLTRKGISFLYTGDFKLRPGLSVEPCIVPHADVIVMETTFGIPRYVFPSTERVVEDLVQFCLSAFENRQVPVFFAYPLGKSQELIAQLGRAQILIMLHPDTYKITQSCKQFGHVLPPYRPFILEEAQGHAVICSPTANQSAWLEKIKNRRTAVVTGWALDSSAIYRHQCDAAFPLSDHTDYNDLLKFVELAQPKQVFTVHGFTGEFAQTLRSRGIEAWALGKSNQLEFSL